MSSEVEGLGIIAAAVALPGLVAMGAGWLAWQGGKYLVEAGRDVDRLAEEKRRQAEEERRNRRNTALQAREQLVQMCRSAIAELESSGGAGLADVRAMKNELLQIINAPTPEDTGALQRMNIQGMAVLERIMQRQNRLGDVSITGSGAYNGMALADVMKKLRLAIEAAEIRATTGADIRAADVEVMERAKLNEQLNHVSARVMAALEFVVDLGENYGISTANNAWFQSCFNGVDERIRALCSPAVSNSELRQGIRALEEIMKQYDMLAPTMEREKAKIASLYPVYAQAAEALGEPIYELRHFKSGDALEAEMHRLEARMEKARKCSEIYQKLGPAAYMCYALDQELHAMGYSVHTRRQITEMAQHRPDRAKLGDAEMPFYQWDDKRLTQLYSIDETCDLQLIVHPDGSTTMETISRTEKEQETVEVQKKHCSALKELHKRLFDNWFIHYDYRETEGPEVLQSVAEWRSSGENTWTAEEAARLGVRENVRTEQTGRQVMEKKD